MVLEMVRSKAFECDILYYYCDISDTRSENHPHVKSNYDPFHKQAHQMVFTCISENKVSDTACDTKTPG